VPTVIAQTAIIDSNVQVGDDAVIEDFVVLGMNHGGDPGALVIGAGSTIRSHTVVYSPGAIGSGFQAGHGVVIRDSADIGDDVSVGTHSILEHHVTLGHRVRIHSGTFIPEFSVVEDDAWIGPRVTLTNARYPRSADVKATLKGPTIRRGAKVGANATVLPGIVIGEGALVGAGAVVVHDVPPNAVVAGNPATVLRDVTDIDAYKAKS